jgi:hypothetical protein
MKTKQVEILMGIVILVLVCLCPAYAQIEVLEKSANTDGDTRGIAVQDYYVYLADGAGGLKIINMSNPYSYVLAGALSLPGCFVEQVAVDSNIVILTDTQNDQVHFVDVSDKMRPELLQSLTVNGDIPRKVEAEGGKAFVLEYGDDPLAPNYFSGIEVFSYGTTIESVQLTILNGVSALAVNDSYLLTGGGNEILLFRRDAVGFVVTPARTVTLAANEELQSLSLWNQYLFAYGKDHLYAVAILKLQLYPHPPILIVWMLDQEPVPGDPVNRRVSASVLDYGNGATSDPYIYLLLTSQKEYGLFFYNSSSLELKPYKMYDFESSTWMMFRDVDEASEGEIEIFDSVFPVYFYPGAFKGGTFGLGAIGSYGLGYVQVKQ